MGKGKGKKLVYVSESLVEGLVRVSKDKGESMNKLIEDALKESVRVNDEGYDVKQIADFFGVMQTHRVLGGVFVPSNVLDYLVEAVYPEGKEQLQKRWFESGRLNGKYLKEVSENPAEALGRFLELSRWDLNEVEVKASGDSVKVRCVSTVLSWSGTELLAMFIEGIMDGLGYKTVKNDFLKGMIILDFKR